MNPHVSMIDQHLGIDHDSQAEEMRLALANALAALRNSNARNGASAQQRDAARRQILRTLRRAA